MKKKIILFTLFALPAVVLAGEATTEAAVRYFNTAGRHYDLKPRIVDFSIFIALIYYLTAKPIKDFFVGRKNSIADKLNEIESKLQDAKNTEKDAQQTLNKSEAQAKEIISDAKKEAELIAQEAQKNLDNDLQIMQKQYEDKQDYEERKMIKETIDNILASNISGDDIPLSEGQVVDTLSKKVA